MGSLSLVLPGPTALALCFFLSLILLALLHHAAAYISRLPIISDEKEGQRANEQESSTRSWMPFVSWTKWPSFDWRSNIRWEGLPQLSLPVSLSVSDNEMVGASVGKGMGVGMELMKHEWQSRRLKPAFDAPPPALYQSQAPLSMAKIIMSRHTIRRPGNKPRPPLQPPARRQQNIV